MDYIALDLLNKHLGTSTKKKGNNYAFFCPFCNHYKQKLEVDIQSGLWNCWACPAKGKSVYSLLKKINAPRSDLNLVATFRVTSHEPLDSLFSDIKKDSSVLLPQYYKALTGLETSSEVKQLINYLNKRGVTLHDIKRYKIGYLTAGPKRNNLVLPSFDEQGCLNYYVLKDISTGEYTNPASSRNIIALDYFINWARDVVIVEGMFDAFAVKKNVTPLLGLTMQKKVKERIVTSKTKNFYICLDAGEEKAISEIATYITSIGKNAYKVELPAGEDPSSLGTDSVWQYIKQAQKVEESDIFLQNLYCKW